VAEEFGFLNVNIDVENVRKKYYCYVERLVNIRKYVKGIIHNA